MTALAAVVGLTRVASHLLLTVVVRLRRAGPLRIAAARGADASPAVIDRRDV